jgi:hypothetical protein
MFGYRPTMQAKIYESRFEILARKMVIFKNKFGNLFFEKGKYWTKCLFEKKKPNGKILTKFN